MHPVDAHLAEIKTRSGGGGDKVPVAISKGRDDAFRGAVDKLQVNNTMYDLEPPGVTKTTL